MASINNINIKSTINCNGRLMELSKPKIMSILNNTPNSFYDGGELKNKDNVLFKTEKMIVDGADFIDIGGYSSKPNAEEVTFEEELNRTAWLVNLIKNYFPETVVSIDTFRSAVALACLQEGAGMVNDISAGFLDEKMLEIVAQFQVPYCMMHLKGTPQNMQLHTNYDDLVKEILFYFSERIAKARLLGINDLIIDPGFGFAKTLDQNYELVQKLNLFKILETPILVGVSRKSMITKILCNTPQEALNGTTVLNFYALEQGANILRVHDVKAAKECAVIFERIKEEQNKN